MGGARYRLQGVLASLALAWLAGCGGGDDGAVEEVDCSDQPSADTYVANMRKPGEAGQMGVVLVSSDPAPPARGDNAWLIELVDSTDQPISGATLTVTPNMPEHDHGTPIDVVVTPGDSDGLYRASPVNLWMPGVWEITIDARVDRVEDSAVFAFCIER